RANSSGNSNIVLKLHSSYQDLEVVSQLKDKLNTFLDIPISGYGYNDIFFYNAKLAYCYNDILIF
ncbi:33462_t:CDS:1, partial [Gigaspora margarita]